MRKIPAVSEMEHITSKEFGENMDAILERVAKENIAPDYRPCGQVLRFVSCQMV